MTDYHSLTDQQLLQLLREEDRRAFTEIYRRYSSLIFSYARKNISASDECKEIVQDLFESLWLRRGVLKIDSLKSYLFTSTRYLMIRYFRRSRLFRQYAEHYTMFESAYESLPDDERSEQAVRARLMKALDGLADRCRTALILRFVENLSNSEIAERMNIAKGTVEVYMVRGVRHLRSTYPSGFHDTFQ